MENRADFFSGNKADVLNVNRFKNLAVGLTDLAFQSGVEIYPFFDENLLHFRALSNLEQDFVLGQLSNYVDICQDTIERGHSLKNDGQLLWSAMRKFGLRPTSDLFQFITPGDIIEIHTANFTQIFRNFSFFEFCSYSLEDLYCRSWIKLYKRPAAIEIELMKVGTQAFSGLYDSTIAVVVPEHIVEETSSRRQLKLRVNMKFGSPLFDIVTGKPAAVISIEAAEKLSSLASPSVPADSFAP